MGITEGRRMGRIFRKHCSIRRSSKAFLLYGRKKDLVKLQFGEYVSLGKVESNLKVSIGQRSL